MQVSAVETPGAASIESSEARAVACGFTLSGDLRFLSHHDELRMLTRALRRAGWPVANSRGFNPQPRIVLPLPRRVGTASECQWAVVQLDDDHPLEQLYGSLATALPGGCSLRRVAALPARAKLHPRQVVFELELEPEHAAEAASRIAKLLAEEALIVERAHGPDKPTSIIDIRPYIETIILDGRKLSMRLAFVQQRTARPSEVLTVLHLPASAYNHRVRQVEVEWNMALAGPEHWPPGAERNNVVQEEDRYSQAQDGAQEESQGARERNRPQR